MHHPIGPAWAQAVEQSDLGVMMRDLLFAYPAANLIHILGLALLVGAVVVLDLRLLGIGRSVPVAAVSRLLTPLLVVGLVLMILSGPGLFASDAGPLSVHPLMQTKMALLLAALINAALFRLVWQSRLAGWDEAPPLWGRAQAVASLFLWLAVAACGRLIAYF